MSIDDGTTQADLGLIAPSIDDAEARPPWLAFQPRIIDAVEAEMAATGVAGEGRAVRLLYLVITTRLLAKPCSMVLKGPSAGGKSYLVGQVLELFPPEAYHVLTAMSDRALAYDTVSLIHRMLVIYEAAGMQSDMASYLMRSLLSEGRIAYTTVDRPKGGLLGSRTVNRDGPTGLITTSTAVSLHPENETRLLSLAVTDTPAQTRAVMLAHARGAAPHRDRTDWHLLQDWLAQHPVQVSIPFIETLAAAIPPVAIRLRRDFSTLTSLIQANALLQQCTRERDATGAVVATIDDYAAVRELVWDLMADAAERAVPATIRETVAAIVTLAQDDILGEGISQTLVADLLGVDKSTASRRVRGAISRGFARNLETGRGRPARLVPGDALPADRSLLPTPEELARLHGCVPDGEEALTDYPPSAWLNDVSAPDPEVMTAALPRRGDDVR